MAKMTFDQFVKKYIGTAIDYDGAAGAQCVDLIKLYLQHVFGISPFSFGGSAKNLYRDYSSTPEAFSDEFKRIRYIKGELPKRGDIVVWGKSKGGGHGHVAIATGTSNSEGFYSYDMNWDGKAMKLVHHDYSGVLGYLRPVSLAGAAKPGKTYFKRYTGNSKSIVDALDAIGQPSSYNYRKQIAKANAISAYAGLPWQNKKMLDLLKNGDLIKP